MKSRDRGVVGVLVAAVLAAGCGRDAQVAGDASPDSPDANTLPPVEPRGPRCEDVDLEPGTRCLQEGWFLFSRWTTVEYYGPGATEHPTVPTRPVYLDTFLVDAHEVTTDEYAEFVTRTQAAPPPDLCGYEDYALANPDPFERTPEISGWVAGVPEAGRGDHPVVCVTRAEAQAFCEDRGGHLPTVFEWARTVRDAYPDARRFPWGDTPPPEAPEPWPDLLNEWYLPYVTMHRGGPGLRTLPVGSAVDGASAAGVLDLAGSVGELLASCAEDLAAIPASTVPLVRPVGGERAARCREGVVVAGSTWRSMGETQLAFASTVYVMRDGYNGFRYPDPTQGPSIVEGVWGYSQPTAPVTDTGGNDRRSWQIGWRCAYDAPAP